MARNALWVPGVVSLWHKRAGLTKLDQSDIPVTRLRLRLFIVQAVSPPVIPLSRPLHPGGIRGHLCHGGLLRDADGGQEVSKVCCCPDVTDRGDRIENCLKSGKH